MDIDQLLKLTRKRRSIRRFKADPVPEEIVNKILEVARWSMSGANGQPWEFIVIKDQKVKNKLAEAYRDWAALSRGIESQRFEELRQPLWTDPVFDTPAGYQPGFKDAPIVIAVCGDPRAETASVVSTYMGGPRVLHCNLSNVTYALQLAAAACGLGAQWVTVNASWEHLAKTILGVPFFYTVFTLVPIGYSDYKPIPPYRRDLAELVHYDQYDMSKCRSHDDYRAWLIELRKRQRGTYHIWV